MRYKHVKIYGIGLPRTGTNSLALALNRLGIHGENYCVLNHHKQKYDTQNNDDIMQPQPYSQTQCPSNYKFYVKNDVYRNVEDFIDEKLDEDKETKFILTDRDKDEWVTSIDNIQEKLNLNSDEYNIPCPQKYKEKVLNYFYQNKIQNNLLILDIFNQKQDLLWNRLVNFLEINESVINNNDIKLNKFPHINLNN